MNGKGGDGERRPQGETGSFGPGEIPQARDPDMEPHAFPVGAVDIRPGGRRQALHTVATGPENDGAEHVD